jgi:hypothetical protein
MPLSLQPRFKQFIEKRAQKNLQECKRYVSLRPANFETKISKQLI